MDIGYTEKEQRHNSSSNKSIWVAIFAKESSYRNENWNSYFFIRLYDLFLSISVAIAVNLAKFFSKSKFY